MIEDDNHCLLQVDRLLSFGRTHRAYPGTCGVLCLLRASIDESNIINIQEVETANPASSSTSDDRVCSSSSMYILNIAGKSAFLVEPCFIEVKYK